MFASTSSPRRAERNTPKGVESSAISTNSGGGGYLGCIETPHRE